MKHIVTTGYSFEITLQHIPPNLPTVSDRSHIRQTTIQSAKKSREV